MQAFVRGIELAPDLLDGYAGLCRICIDGEGVDEGKAMASDATRSINRPIELLKGMAFALEGHGRYQEARSYWEQVLKRIPDDVLALLRAARVEQVLRDIEGAGYLYDKAMTLYPANLSAIWEYAHFLIHTGRFNRAVALLRDAISSQPAILSQFGLESPSGIGLEWNGTQNLSRKTILVKGWGGFGDFIYYSHFTSLIKECGARVIFECPSPLQRLCATLPGVDEVVAPHDECSPFDYQCRLDFAAIVLEWTWEWVAKNSPYLFVDDGQQSRWRERLGRDGIKIGINWRSAADNARDKYCFRSMPLTDFRLLSSLPNVKIFSLQVGSGGEELAPSTRNWITDDLSGEFKDFEDTAAAVMALDAVVTVDTSVAHLAGALGKPCFVMLPYYPCTRWMSESEVFKRNICLWYPAMRLFRQDRPGEWSPIIKEVTQAVSALAGVTDHD
jgi:tetratricopeptide (TPR) repeat protein